MKLRAEVYTRKQLGETIENRHIEKIYAPYNIIDKSLVHEQKRIIIVPPVYLADCEDDVKEKLLKLKEQGFENALVHTVGHIELLSAMGFNMHGGHRLNCTNSDTIAFLYDNNVKDIIVSPELTAYQINQLEKRCEAGFLAYGHLPLMITRRCPVRNGKPCNKECCNRTIKDRMNNEMHIICSENTAEILNSDVLYLGDKLYNFDGADFAVLKFTIESGVNDIIEAYWNEEAPKQNKFTRGLYFRGIKS